MRRVMLAAVIVMLAVPAGGGGSLSAAEISTKEVKYAEINGGKIKGFLAAPALKTGGAGVIVIHGEWGLNDRVRDVAGLLAGEGYQALAVDLYESPAATSRKEAAALMRGASERSRRLEENLRQAVDYLTTQRRCSRVGVVGWSFGGGWSLQTALLMPDRIDAAVIYYGRLITAAPALEALNMPILGLFAAYDRNVPSDRLRKFEETLRSLGREASIHVYDETRHGFADTASPRYDEQAAADAWEKTVSFFRRHLQAPPPGP